ncbi:MAG: protein kinase [Vicinamibacteria bacterium]|nr:protein kinase [Vicinamibacteria bacterium]
MTLKPGTRLGPYEITGAIGAGGMGEVFRARDTKLNRDVAIKVLPAAFADDPERLARFTREAQTLASPNHPNIAGIYGIEEVPAVSGSTGPGSRALVGEPVSKGLQWRRRRGGAAQVERRDGCACLRLVGGWALPAARHRRLARRPRCLRDDRSLVRSTLD